MTKCPLWQNCAIMIWVFIHLFFRLFCVLKVFHNFKSILSISSNPYRADSPHLMFLEISIHFLFDYVQKWGAHYHRRLFIQKAQDLTRQGCTLFLLFFSLTAKRAKRLKEKKK